jgi:hypothetical protein
LKKTIQMSEVRVMIVTRDDDSLSLFKVHKADKTTIHRSSLRF